MPPRVANCAAYSYSRVSRSMRRMRAWRVSGLTGIAIRATPDLEAQGTFVSCNALPREIRPQLGSAGQNKT